LVVSEFEKVRNLCVAVTLFVPVNQKLGFSVQQHYNRDPPFYRTAFITAGALVCENSCRLAAFPGNTLGYRLIEIP
jgi:hypothetical protein